MADDDELTGSFRERRSARSMWANTGQSVITNAFATLSLPLLPTEVAPDGADVRVLLGLSGGTMSHFTLGAGIVAHAVSHRTVDEIWYVVSGRGEMWRRQGEHEETVVLEPGVCLTIPVGTHFQYRASGREALSAVAVTMPPWPGDDEVTFVPGPWEPSCR